MTTATTTETKITSDTAQGETMTTTTSTTEVRDALEALDPDEYTWQHVADTVEIAAIRTGTCDCGQTVTMRGPDAWLDAHGDIQGWHSHQHGCGTWNAPASVIRHDVTTADTVDAMLAELVATDEALDAKLRRKAQAELDELTDVVTKAVRDAIAADADEDEIMETAIGAGAIAVDYEDGLMVTVGGGLVVLDGWVDIGEDHVESYAVIER